MKILIYGLNFSPERIGVGRYTGETVTWLSRRGRGVRVVTAPPHYPNWLTHNPYSCLRYRCQKMDGVTVWRCPLSVPRRPRGWSRIWHLLSFAMTSLPVVLMQIFWRPRVVLVVTPTLFCAPTGWLVARLCGAKAWLHLQDFELDVALGLGMMHGDWLARTGQTVERFWLRRFDRVSTISDKMMGALAAKGVDADRRVLFPNWVDTKAICPLDGVSPMLAELGVPAGTRIVLYAGNMGYKQGLEIIIDAAQRLAEERELLFVLAGQGAAREELQRKAEGLPNVRWLPLQPEERLNDLLSMADIHLLPQKGDTADLVMPSKLGGMLASGRPVIATVLPGTQIAKVLGGCGRIVPPGDAGAFAEEILWLANEPEARKRLGAAARQYAVEHLDKEAILSQFERDLMACVGE